jgi:hypothetical protein
MAQHKAVVAQLRAAAHALVPTREVALDIDNPTGIVRIVTERKATDAEKKQLRLVVGTAGQQAFPAALHWRCFIHQVGERPYTSHVLNWRLAASHRQRLHVQPQDVVVFSFSLLEVDALRRARTMLTRTTQTARIVATFALGGLPLLHWLTLPVHMSVDSIEAARKAAPRYHLLPGLNWSGTQAERNYFRDWLKREVEGAGGHILVFDTGRDGNGVREALQLAEEVVRAARPQVGTRITVLGVLDGRFRRGRRLVVSGRNNVRVTLALKYEFVAHLPTEDCEILAGYQVDRRRTWMQPIDALVLLRVFHTPWVMRQAECLLRCLRGHSCFRRFADGRVRATYVATSGGGTSVHTLVAGAGREDVVRRLRAPVRAERDLDGAATLLAHAESKELAALATAVRWGFIPVGAEQGVAANITGRFASARQRLLRVRWNRESKSVVVL